MCAVFFETARACMQLILSGTVGRCPDIRFIIPQCVPRSRCEQP
jgi:hypothetical protein